jgi:hypothetical protein
MDNKAKLPESCEPPEGSHRISSPAHHSAPRLRKISCQDADYLLHNLNFIIFLILSINTINCLTLLLFCIAVSVWKRGERGDISYANTLYCLGASLHHRNPQATLPPAYPIPDDHRYHPGRVFLYAFEPTSALHCKRFHS